MLWYRLTDYRTMRLSNLREVMQFLDLMFPFLLNVLKGFVRKQAVPPSLTIWQAATKRVINTICAVILIPDCTNVKAIQWRYLPKSAKNLRCTARRAVPVWLRWFKACDGIIRVRPAGNVSKATGVP